MAIGCAEAVRFFKHINFKSITDEFMKCEISYYYSEELDLLSVIFQIYFYRLLLRKPCPTVTSVRYLLNKIPFMIS